MLTNIADSNQRAVIAGNQTIWRRRNSSVRGPTSPSVQIHNPTNIAIFIRATSRPISKARRSDKRNAQRAFLEVLCGDSVSGSFLGSSKVGVFRSSSLRVQEGYDAGQINKLVDSSMFKRSGLRAVSTERIPNFLTAIRL